MEYAPLNSPVSFLHAKASGNTVSESPLRPANDPTKRSDRNPQHQTSGVFFTPICCTENNSTDISGNVHNSQWCPRDLYLLQLSPCRTSLSLNQDRLPRAITNTAFQPISQCSEGVLPLPRLQSCTLQTVDSTRHRNASTPKYLTSWFLQTA